MRADQIDAGLGFVFLVRFFLGFLFFFFAQSVYRAAAEDKSGLMREGGEKLRAGGRRKEKKKKHMPRMPRGKISHWNICGTKQPFRVRGED